MISAEKQSIITKVTKKKIDDIIYQLQVHPTKDNLIKFMDIVGSGIEQNLNIRFIAEKTKVVLKVNDLTTWSFLLDYFEHKGQVYPAICCAEALLLARGNTELKKRYARLQVIYDNKKKKDLLFIQKTFKENPPKFTISVIMPTYNRHQYIGRAIRSVLNQSFKDFELIIINDGGSRECEKIISSFKSKKIRYLYIKHSGLSYALNKGILASRAKYIAYLDDDDQYFSNHLQTLALALEESSYPVVYTDGCRIVKKHKDGKQNQISKTVDISYDFNPGLFAEKNYIPILCIAHRRDCLEQIGLFEKDLPNVMDWDLWYKTSRFYDFKHIKKTTCEYEYRLGPDSLSGKQLDHIFFSIILQKHHQYQTRHIWNDVVKRVSFGFIKYEEMEREITRYTNDNILLAEWLLPFAFTERKLFYAYNLIEQMIMNNSKKAVFVVIRQVFLLNISILARFFILLFTFISLFKKLIKRLFYKLYKISRLKGLKNKK